MIYVVVQDFQERVTRVYSFTDEEKEMAFEVLHNVERLEFEFEMRGQVVPGRACFFRADSLDTLKYTHGNWFYDDTRVYPWSAESWLPDGKMKDNA